MIQSAQMPERFRAVIHSELEHWKANRSITIQKRIPSTDQIPIENPANWLRIPDVICVFVDMAGSTKLSASTKDRETAGVYRLFTETAVRLFHEVDSPYIDVKGDGAFALFDFDQPHRALAAAVNFKTFAEHVFTSEVKSKLALDVGVHIGIDRKTVLVRKIGLKIHDGRTDRQNEVWAGKPVNMAAKLAGRSSNKQLWVSDRFFKQLTHERALRSCGCPRNEVTDLWEKMSVRDDDRFDFDDAYILKSSWCVNHGAEFCESLLAGG